LPFCLAARRADRASHSTAACFSRIGASSIHFARMTLKLSRASGLIGGGVYTTILALPEFLDCSISSSVQSSVGVDNWLNVLSLRESLGTDQNVTDSRRRNAPTSLALHEPCCAYAQWRSGDGLPVSTMPQGIPGDAGEGRAWSIRRRGYDNRQRVGRSWLS
jgi:hypothetical protein